MKRMVCVAAACGAAISLAQVASADVYTDSGSFLANVQPGFYFNDFTGVPTGAVTSLSFGPVNGFAYTIDAVGGNGTGLFNDVGVVSLDSASDSLRVTFTGADVTAVGGNFWTTDIAFGVIPGTVTINLSDGTTETFATSSPTTFRGFTSNVPIDSMTIASIWTTSPAWPTMDNFYVGQAVPAPASLALLGLGGLVAGRRRR